MQSGAFRNTGPSHNERKGISRYRNLFCLSGKPDERSIINHAINRDYQFFTPLTAIGEVILIMKRDAKFAEHLTSFFSLLTEWKMTILVPTNGVVVICYEFSQDVTDGRMIQPEDGPDAP